jgi:SOS-response transcriptional repressor LexA
VQTSKPTTRKEILLLVIQRYIKQHGYSPSVQDLEELTVNPDTGKGYSFGSIQWNLAQLVREGHITRIKGRGRTIRLT